MRARACSHHATRSTNRSAEPSSAPLALERARANLAYEIDSTGGASVARQPRAAHEAFLAIRAQPWQARAAAQLRATGEEVADQTRPLPALTSQELHIAALVADGKTNKEIAAALFLSPNRIEYHLANTFRKLDIHSRAELARIWRGTRVRSRRRGRSNDRRRVVRPPRHPPPVRRRRGAARGCRG